MKTNEKTTTNGQKVGCSDLLACPFCSKTEKEEDGYPEPPTIYNGYDKFTDIDDRGSPPYYIQCTYCLSRGPAADNPVDASDWWNDRPIIPANVKLNR